LAGKDEKRKKRPVVTPSPKIPAPKRIPGGRPLQPKYEKPGQPEGTAGVAPSKIEPPTPKPGKGPDRSLSGHWVELGEPAQKKEEKKAPPKVNVKMNLIGGLVAGLIAAGVIVGVFWSQGFFGGGGGGAQTWSIYSYSGQQYATATVNSSGSFTATGWTGYAAGIGSYNISISGSMSGTTMSFNLSASFGGGQGSISGTYTGTLNASFPNATSASGTGSGTISYPGYSGLLTDIWTATRVS
jgi:hypothetical protein